LRACIPAGLIRRIEHFGSTAIPGLAAKPVVDMLVEVSSLRAARTEIAAVLRSQGYDYFWRPSFGDDVPPWYAFFIKRARNGIRTHHIHMITRHRTFREHWDAFSFAITLFRIRRPPAIMSGSRWSWPLLTRTTVLPTRTGKQRSSGA